MREVPVPTAFAAHCIRCPLMLLAAWLVALQAFLAGVATAQAGAMAASDPLAVICHAAGGSDPADGPGSDARKVWHLCCTFCLSSTPALISPDGLVLARADTIGPVLRPMLSSFGVILARGAVRAGPSQGPPALA
jgi:hypothetical protein